MKITRTIVVLDAADVDAVSAFWSGVLGGKVERSDDWHEVYDAEGNHRVDVQLAPDHVLPQWPDGTQQQVHLDIYVEDFAAAHAHVMSLGAQLLQTAEDRGTSDGFQVYADPAGHPFCLCWG